MAKEAKKMEVKIDKGNLFEKLMPVLLVATIGLAFGVGVLWQKVQNLESGGVKVANTGGAAQPAAQTGPKLSVDDLKGYAKDLGLDTGKFNSCLDNGAMAGKVSGQMAYGEEVGITGTPGFFLNGRLIEGAQPYSVFKEAIDFELSGGNWNNAPASIANSVAKNVTPIDYQDGQQKGDKNAKVVLVEFSDFECPFCARFYTQTYLQLKKEYVDTGKVQFIYKHFPLISIHPNAQKAAEASECAGEQGKFWEMHDKLFESHGF